MIDIAPDLAATLDAVRAVAGQLEDDWWVFGSAGMAMVGVRGLSPPDLDLIVSERDARRLIMLWKGEVEASRPSALFRSRLFAKARVAPLPIEIMTHLEVQTGDGWQVVLPQTRQANPWRDGFIFTPTASEQAEICRLFGRPKDLARIAALEALA
ncbi:hypothetical protein [Phenylobacterium sp.]|uniref:hypothetical protein n=1 Tax=Phenylobacterium sp. TaxID=1871053 RepID=UPI002FCB20C8